jgi:hypothetical protein
MKKMWWFSLQERVILSAGAMLIFSVLFQIDQMSADWGGRKMLVGGRSFIPKFVRLKNLVCAVA